MELIDLKVGMVLQKGNRKRIFLGINGFMAYYTTPSSKNTTGVLISNFTKWLENAEVVVE